MVVGNSSDNRVVSYFQSQFIESSPSTRIVLPVYLCTTNYFDPMGHRWFDTDRLPLTPTQTQHLAN